MTGKRIRPRLEVVFELEELPRLAVVAGSYEDEQRLRAWLKRPATCRALTDSLADALDGLREAA